MCGGLVVRKMYGGEVVRWVCSMVVRWMWWCGGEIDMWWCGGEMGEWWCGGCMVAWW